MLFVELCVKCYIDTQDAVAWPSGQSEFLGFAKAATMGLDKALLGDIGIDVEVQISPGPNDASSIVSKRGGTGIVTHIWESIHCFLGGRRVSTPPVVQSP